MVGIFDSGVGGLSVLRAIREKAPALDIVYFGDTENAPYGPKSKKEIARLIAMALRRLHAEGCTRIVAACNSASVSVASIPIDLLRLGVFEVVEMIEPTVTALADAQKPIVLFGTEATVGAGIYQDAFRRAGIDIVAIPIPALAGLIESGAPREEVKRAVALACKEALAAGAKTISLSCTHYPFVKDIFEGCLREQGSGAVVFDPAEAVAEEAVKRFGREGKGALHFLISKDSPIFRSYVKNLFGTVPHTVEVASTIYHALKTV